MPRIVLVVMLGFFVAVSALGHPSRMPACFEATEKEKLVWIKTCASSKKKCLAIRKELFC